MPLESLLLFGIEKNWHILQCELNNEIDAINDIYKGEKFILTLISFVIPCYRSEKTIELVIREIITVVAERNGYDYEIIAINDFSTDNVYSVLRGLAKENHKIKVINFSKNMGKHAAVLAGYSVAKGDYVVDLDDDFQCPTYELWRLLEPLELDECDVTIAEYNVKKENLIKRIGSNINCKMTNILLEKPKDIRFENFSIRKKFVCDEMIKYRNPYPFLEGLTLRVTHRIKTVPMEQRDRADDNRTGFTLKKSFSLLLNGLTAFSVKPLRISTVMGIIVAMAGFLWGIVIIARRIINVNMTVGYSSMMATMLFLGGIIMIMLGLIGEYVGRIYISVNDAPQYVIRNTINLNDKEERDNG